MTLRDPDLAGRLARTVGSSVEIEPINEHESRVSTAFQFADGDHLVTRLRRVDGDRYEWTDLGHTFMHLSYGLDVDSLEEGKRGEPPGRGSRPSRRAGARGRACTADHG